MHGGHRHPVQQWTGSAVAAGVEGELWLTAVPAAGPGCQLTVLQVITSPQSLPGAVGVFPGGAAITGTAQVARGTTGEAAGIGFPHKKTV